MNVFSATAVTRNQDDVSIRNGHDQTAGSVIYCGDSHKVSGRIRGGVSSEAGNDTAKCGVNAINVASHTVASCSPGVVPRSRLLPLLPPASL